MSDHRPPADPGADAFAFDAGLRRYEATVELAGGPVALRVAEEAFGDQARLREVLRVVGRAHAQVVDEVVDELLEVKNDEWLRTGERPVSEADFRRQLSLAAVEVGPDAQVEVLFDDDGMFWGHQVVVRVDETGRPMRVDVEG